MFNSIPEMNGKTIQLQFVGKINYTCISTYLLYRVHLVLLNQLVQFLINFIQFHFNGLKRSENIYSSEHEEIRYTRS